MRELIFLQKYKDRWLDLENLLKANGPKDPDRLSSLYIQLNDDLSYARTYYPESNVVEYLNGLSVQLHKEIYKNKKEDKGRIKRFFLEEIPDIIFKMKSYNLITLFIFILGITLGWVSANIDSSFTRMMMGNEYIDLTLKNIESGKAMNIYGKVVEGEMFYFIAANNLYVVVLYFLLGLILGLGALIMLFRFGIYIGSFFQFMYMQDVLGETMTAMWIHGVIEITCAVIGTAAGTKWGMSYIFPGTYSRSDAFKIASKECFKVLIGLLPLIIIAAFIESFITRHYDYSYALSISIIFTTFMAILYYFVIYPYQRHLAQKLELK